MEDSGTRAQYSSHSAVKRASQKLAEYHGKRSPSATNEPFGDEVLDAAQGSASGTLSGAYVVHLHDATRRHYDLRLEVGGVLASFAVPRGPSLDPDEKGLAVKTEDHPIEYLEFEDVIPAKQYGAGPMIAWDRGIVEYLEGPAEEEIARGKLDLVLRGLKLRGRFALVKLKKSGSERTKGDEWLLFKKKDDFSSKERRIVDELPRSVFSGLTVEELENKDAVARRLEKEARAIGEPLGTSVIAELAPIGTGKPKGRAWIYDADLEGIRVLASRVGDVVTLSSFDASGSPRAIEAFYPDVVRALRALPVTRLVVDGELVTFDASGRPSMKLLAERAARISRGPAHVHRATTTTPATLVVSDLLALGDVDVRGAPIERRRALLAKLLPPIGFLRAAPTLEGDLDRVLASCAALELPGVVAKKKGSAYDRSRGANVQWLFVSSGVPRSRVTVDHDARDTNAALRKVTISNRAKVFWPDEGLTKGDLCDFYGSIADTVLPYLVDRPVILVRYPDGIDGKSFYQWNVPPGMPPWVRTMSFTGEDDEPRRGFLVDDASTLLYMANLACIPVHILACRVPNLEQADFFTIDFDIKQSELRHAITLARTLKEILDEIGLPGFPKTSGQTGLHVLCPLGKGQSFQTACALANLLGKLLVDRHPDIATMERIVKRRGPKVYVDTGQTGEARAIVAPYSVRAVKGARVSTPLRWSEVNAKLDPGRYTMKTVPARIAELGDPMRDMLKVQPNVARAVAKLAELVKDVSPSSDRDRTSRRRWR